MSPALRSLLLVAGAMVLAPSGAWGSGAPPDRLERIAVLGASVSDGFNLSAELHADIALSDVLASAMKDGRRPVAVATSSMMFRAPLEMGRRFVDRVLDAHPTIVFALDFLFWFGYGALPGGEEARLALLEQGLDQLDRIDALLVVGDFPDVSAALHGKGPFGPMIRADQVPAPETLERLNHRLAEWADGRGDVVLVSLADDLARLQKGERIEIRGNVVEGEALGELMQPDLLHPTVDGTILLVLFALDRVVEEREDVDPAQLAWSFAEIRGRLLAATADERARRLERERRRQERKRRKAEERSRRREDGEESPARPSPRSVPRRASRSERKPSRMGLRPGAATISLLPEPWGVRIRPQGPARLSLRGLGPEKTQEWPA